MTAIPPDAQVLTVPDHLDGARPAGLGARFWAHVVDWLLLSLLQVLLYGSVLIGAGAAASSGSDSMGVVAAFVVLGLVLAAMLKCWVVDLWRRGQTPGMRAAGVVWARWGAPGSPGGAVIGKILLQDVIASVTGGLANIVVYLVSRDDYGRFWFDRVSGLVAVDARTGTNPVTAGREAAAQAVAASPAPVTVLGTLPAALPVPSSPAAGAPATDLVPDPATDPETDPGTPLAPVPMRTAVPADVLPPLPAGPPPAAPAPASSARPTRTSPATGPSTTASVPTTAGQGSGLITSVPWEDPAPGETSTFVTGGASPAAPSAPVAPADGAQPLTPLGTQVGGSAHAPLMVPLSARAGGPVGGATEDDAMERTVARPVTLPGLRLRLDSGQAVPLTGTVLLGRDPAAVDPWTGAALVPVVDPERSISKTHLAVSLEGTRALVQDLGSTNGTLVVGLDGALTHALPGTPVDAPVGATVRFGERSLTVER